MVVHGEGGRGEEERNDTHQSVYHQGKMLSPHHAFIHARMPTTTNIITLTSTLSAC